MDFSVFIIWNALICFALVGILLAKNHLFTLTVALGPSEISLL